MIGIGLTRDSGDELFERTGKSPFSWKKLVGELAASSAAIIFGIAILLMSFLAASDPERVRPNTEEVMQIAGVTVATSEAKPTTIDYYLPYPGLLPDSPFYKIKALRDKIVLVFTFDEEKKVKKELLYADKRINAALVLIEGGKKSLGVTTLTKSEKYLEQAILRVERLKKEGKDEKSLLLELGKASAKHAELMEGLKTRMEGDQLKALELSLATTKMLGQRVGQMLLESK